MSTFTPGPWEAESGGGRGAWIKGATGEWAALACGDTDGSADANARLIAAAPDLLDIACQPKVTDIGGTLYIGFYDELSCDACPVPPEMRGFVERWAARRDAAIAKAEGQS